MIDGFQVKLLIHYSGKKRAFPLGIKRVWLGINKRIHANSCFAKSLIKILALQNSSGGVGHSFRTDLVKSEKCSKQFYVADKCQKRKVSFHNS